MERIKTIWKNSYDELVNKVSWPTWEELVDSTIIVLVASLLFAVVIQIMDSVSQLITKFLY